MEACEAVCDDPGQSQPTPCFGYNRVGFGQNRRWCQHSRHQRLDVGGGDIARPLGPIETIPVEEGAAVAAREAEIGLLFTDGDSSTADEFREEAVEGLQMQGPAVGEFRCTVQKNALWGGIAETAPERRVLCGATLRRYRR